MRILVVGDLVGENAVKKLKEHLATIKKEEKIDFVIVNAENAAGGMGITTAIFQDLLKLQIDVMTMGNHTWGKKDIFSFIEHPKLLRPANYSKGVVGKGLGIYSCKDRTIAVINLIGRTDMGVQSDNPFTAVDDILETIKETSDIVIIDFHAEATAEKIAMKHYVDGRATILFGTHTHVQTADEEITKQGMGYITDIGMTGPIDSVIGMDKQASIKRFVTSLPERYKLAEGRCKLDGCIFEIEEQHNKVIEVRRLHIL